MASFYKSEGAESRQGPPSVVDDDFVAGDQRQSGAKAGGMGHVERADPVGVVLQGRERSKHDPRKMRYDVVRGRGKGLPFVVSRDSIMSAEEAGEKLHQLHVLFGLEAAPEGILYAFDSALWFCHTVNSGSVLVPGRSKFSVPGHTKLFDYGEVRNYLGVDFRRFFRAFADDITATNIMVLRDYDPADPVRKEMWGWLMEVAYERGLSRYPHLAHDSANACLDLSPTERQALHQSKLLTVGGTTNAADRLRPVGAVASADRYDSTVGDNY